MPVVLLATACGDGTLTSPVGDEPSNLEADQLAGPQARMAFALARYNRDQSAENLATLREAKAEYVQFRLRESERRRKQFGFTQVLAKAAVDEGWSGGTTEWTFSWQGSLNVPNGTTVQSPQTVAGHGTILDVDIEVGELYHVWTQDLLIDLISPAGTASELFYGNPHAWDVDGLADHPDPTVNLIGTYFDDEASVNISAWDNGALGPFTGSFQPYGIYNFGEGYHAPPRYPLSLMNGQDMYGSWNLRVEDVEAPDPGLLNAWRLIVTLQGKLPAGAVGTAYDATPTGIGTDGTYSWSVVSGALPAGLSLNATTGRITGTPTATGTSSFTVQGAAGATTASATLSITINAALQIASPATLPDGAVGSAYPATQFTATGGGGGYTWSASGLPAGLSMTPGGLLQGTPTSAGTTTVTVSVTSADGQAASVQRTVTVADAALAITTTTPVLALAGGAFTLTLQAVGGGGGYTWSISAGTLPEGLSLSGATISGTPQAEEVQTVTVAVTSSNGSTASKDLTFQVTDPNEPVAVVTGSALPGGVRSEPYATTLEASGADHNYTWTLVGGALPGGLTLASNGTISGTPTLAGAYSFTLEVQGGYGSPAEATFTLEVVNPAVTVATTSLAAGVWGAAYSATFQATGGTGSYSWSLASGSLPTGLSLSADQLSGTPTEPGSFTFTLQASSGVGAYVRTATATFTVDVDYPDLVITTPSLRPAGTGDSYNEPLSATGGNNVYSWSLASGSLPPGLAITGSAVEGTPSAAGFFSFTVQVQSGAGAFVKTATRDLTVSVYLSVPQTAADCAAPDYSRYRFQTEAQCVRFVETGMDSREGEFPDLVIEDAGVPAGTTETAYGFTFTASGGPDNPDSFREWAADGMPGWLSFDATTGALSGTPLIAGDYPFSVTVSSYDDIHLWSASLDVVLSVTWSRPRSGNICANGVWADYGFNNEAQCRRYVDTGMDSRLGQFPDPVVTTSSLPRGQPGVPYALTLAATGGVDNPGSYYTWAVAGLPGWLTLDAATGLLSGIPVEDATYPLTVTVTSIDDGIGYNVTSVPVSLSLLISSRLDPETRDDCKKGGWEQYGFRNQGQCIAFVNTGHDSRDGA